MIKRGIKPGYHEKLMVGKSYKDWLDLTKYVHDVLAEQNYPVTGDCCIAAPADSDIGKALVIGADKKISLVTIAGVGGSVSAVSLGTTTSTTQQIVVTGGTNFLLPQATTSLAGLLSAADKTKLSFITVAANVDLANVGNLVTLSGVAANGTNLGTFTGNTIADNLTIKAALQSLETAVEANLNRTENYFQVNPTGVNTVANITPVPLDPSKVQISINGLIEKTGITVSSGGVVTVNSGVLGYSIDTTDTIEFQYLS